MSIRPSLARTLVLTILSTGLISSTWGYSFQQISITSGTDHAETGLARLNGGEDVLTGSYNRTSFSITLVKEHFPGMCSFPKGIHYGESSRFLWVYSHNRVTDGTTLIDVTTGRGVYGAYGHGSDISPDGKRIAYSTNGMFGLFYRACINDFAVYPNVVQMPRQKSLVTRGTVHASDDWDLPQFKTPQMEMIAYHEWLDNDTVCFIHGEHTRVAEQADNPALAKYWYVQVDGLKDGFSTDTIKTSRAQLTSIEVEQVQTAVNDTDNLNQWPYTELARVCKHRLKPVTAESFEHDVFDHPDWPIMPPSAKLDTYPSPSGTHTISLGRNRIDTDMSYGVLVTLDGAEVHEVASPLGRLLAPPRWLDDTLVELLVQEGWVENILTGTGTPRDFLVTLLVDNNTTKPKVTKKLIMNYDTTALMKPIKK